MKKIIIGIDIGGSTTKIVGLDKKSIIGTALIKATDPIASLFGAFGKFTYTNNISLDKVEKIMLTGVGASYIKEPIYNITTEKSPEFIANGLGGLFLTGLEKALVVSMGTGTALVLCNNATDIKHIGGTAIGGGTIIGLAKKMINIGNIDLVIEMAKKGNLDNIDLTVGNITNDPLPTLPPETTAANFGNVSDVASNNDIAKGIINLVLQSIYTSSIFATFNTSITDIVLIGNISNLPQCKELVPKMEALTKAKFIIPNHSVFGTAIGAALYNKDVY